MKKFFTVQVPLKNGKWEQCGNSHYMDFNEAISVYRACCEHIACAIFQINPATGEFDTAEYERNF